METSELLKKVRKIEIKTKGLSKQIFSGEYHSAFKGRGMSFSEVRQYQYGDDVRNIDWNVTARTQDPFIKVFEEERELTVMLLVDVSKSSYFGSSQTKRDFITELSAVIAFSAMNNNDKVGLLFFSEKIELYIPPKKGKKHILRIIRELIDFEPELKGTNLKLGLEYLTSVIKKRSICFVLSDFMVDGYDTAIRIAGRRHDIIGMHIYDSLEAYLPNLGLLKVYDAESEQLKVIDTTSKFVRDQHNQRFEDNKSKFYNAFRLAGCDTISLESGKPYVSNLLNFFKKRHK